MVTIGIVGNGPEDMLPDLSLYKQKVDIWIGADRGALILLKKGISVDYALGDFDSINKQEKQKIKNAATFYQQYPIEKDQTDIEITILKAFELDPSCIYLFGVTGGRLDHELINIQLLHSIVGRKIRGIIIDQYNQLELTMPGHHKIEQDDTYPNISFVPFTQTVKQLTLAGFYYPLHNQDISWGSTLCISNKLLSNSGNYSYVDGILLTIKSRDNISYPIPKMM